VAAHLAGAPAELTVELDGGELQVEIDDQLRVRLTGWAEPVYAGELSAELLRALEALD
jgi:diaminopimelate epimerase